MKTRRQEGEVIPLPRPLSDQLLEEIRAEFPAFRVFPKDASVFCRVLDVALRVVTLGGQREFMTHYHTVIGSTLYVPATWDDTPDVERAITLRHERVHLRQRRRLGDVLLAFVYLVPVFPIGLAYGRARLEWEAYVETIRATAELRGALAARSDDLRERILRQFTSPAYGWMWPFRGTLERWYERALEEIEEELRTRER